MNGEEMHELACAYARAGDERSLEAALTVCLPLCDLIAHRFSGRGVETEDLRQVAAMACVDALKAFDPSRGLRFTTFVTPTVTGRVRNYIRDKGSLLHTPRSVKEQAALLRRARREWTNAMRREPSVGELAEKLNWSQDRVLETLQSMEADYVASLHATDEEGVGLESKIADPQDAFAQLEGREDLRRAMAGLSAEERLLLSCRFSEGLSQRETAARMNVSQMQVSRMERRILSALRREME